MTTGTLSRLLSFLLAVIALPAAAELSLEKIRVTVELPNCRAVTFEAPPRSGYLGGEKFRTALITARVVAAEVDDSEEVRRLPNSARVRKDWRRHVESTRKLLPRLGDQVTYIAPKWDQELCDALEESEPSKRFVFEYVNLCNDVGGAPSQCIPAPSLQMVVLVK